MKKLVLVVSIFAMWLLLACPLSEGSGCISKVDGDEEKVTSVTISVFHCDSGTILPQVDGIIVTNGKTDVLKITQKGKEDFILPGDSKQLPNGEKDWKVVKLK